MKTCSRVNQWFANLLIPAAMLAATPATFAEPPDLSDLPDKLLRIQFGSADPFEILFVVGDLETPPGDLVVTAISSNTNVLPDANLSPGGSGTNRTLTITPATQRFGTTEITVTARDSDSESTSKRFRLKVIPSTPETGIPAETGGLGLIARVIRSGPLGLPEVATFYSGPHEDYAGLAGDATITGIGNFFFVDNAILINGGPGGPSIAAETGIILETSPGRVYGYYPAAALRGYQDGTRPAPTANSPLIGPGLSGLFRPPGSYNDSLPGVDIRLDGSFEDLVDNSQPPIIWEYETITPSFADAPLANTPAIGLIHRDAVSNAIVAGDSVPPRSVPPPGGTGTTFTSFDPGGISINSNYVAFFGRGTLFSGVYARKLADGELFAAVESFPFQQGDLGVIWGAFLAGERDIFFNATGVYHADAEGAAPAALILANGTEYQPGKFFTAGNLLHVAGSQGVIAGTGEGGKSTIFLLNLNDFSVREIAQQGNAVPGHDVTASDGTTFGVVQRPAVSDAMVVFEAFDQNFQFLGLFARMLDTWELKTVARVGDMIDGKQVRTLGSNPGALNGAVLGFTAYFTDNSSAAYLTTSPVATAVPLRNISTRANVETGDNVLIGGFILTAGSGGSGKTIDGGAGGKRVIIRAIGPSLAGAGLQNPLADPVLELHPPSGPVVTNDNWRDTQEQEIIASTIAPMNDLESAIIATLDPGPYTAIVRGKDGATGVGLVEIYDLDPAAPVEAGNISTRCLVQTGEDVLIGGIIVGGEPGTASIVVVRAIGPSLATVPNPLQDPTLTLYDASGSILAINDDWRDTQEAEIEAANIAPNDDRESAIAVALRPGAYTAIVRGKNSSTGVGLVEAYNLAAPAGAAPR